MLVKRFKYVTSETVGAQTGVSVELISACCVVHARRRGAFVNINSTVNTFESIGAETRAVVDAVRAVCAVEAR